jgi:hypothetical protein
MLHRITLVALLLLLTCSTGCRRDGTSGFGRNLANVFTGRTALDAVQKMENEYFPDQRREGINRLVQHNFGRREPYTTRYQQIAQLDSDFLVRATAVRALNRARDDQSTHIFIAALKDEHPIVRLEGAKALNNVPDPVAIPVLLQIVGDSTQGRDLRIAAAEALRHYRSLDVARSLINVLGERDFSVAWQARRSLVAMTGTDHRYDPAAWLNYLATSPAPLG